MSSKLSRIQKAIAYLKGQQVIIRQQDIVDRMGMNKSTVSMAINGNEKYLTDSFIERFSETFDFNKTWIIEGEGEMLENKEVAKTKLTPREAKDTIDMLLDHEHELMQYNSFRVWKENIELKAINEALRKSSAKGN